MDIFNAFPWVYMAPNAHGPIFGGWETTIEINGVEFVILIHDRPTREQWVENVGDDYDPKRDAIYVVEIPTVGHVHEIRGDLHNAATVAITTCIKLGYKHGTQPPGDIPPSPHNVSDKIRNMRR